MSKSLTVHVRNPAFKTLLSFYLKCLIYLTEYDASVSSTVTVFWSMMLQVCLSLCLSTERQLFWTRCTLQLQQQAGGPGKKRRKKGGEVREGTGTKFSHPPSSSSSASSPCSVMYSVIIQLYTGPQQSVGLLFIAV